MTYDDATVINFCLRLVRVLRCVCLCVCMDAVKRCCIRWMGKQTCAHTWLGLELGRYTKMEVSHSNIRFTWSQLLYAWVLLQNLPTSSVSKFLAFCWWCGFLWWVHPDWRRCHFMRNFVLFFLLFRNNCQRIHSIDATVFINNLNGFCHRRHRNAV